ncbi:mevalonate kinase [Candidatus Bathyarchaeota archaeon]|nr:MAG: mevalonate kinase [Candidatus Bathyarchaeota archaeon]
MRIRPRHGCHTRVQDPWRETGQVAIIPDEWRHGRGQAFSSWLRGDRIYEVSSSSPSTSLSTISSRAPGKIILSGEQFVVLGAPAVAMAVNLYSKIDVRPSQSGRIEVTADIPLHLVGDADKRSSSAENQELLEPLRLAASATLDHLGTEERSVHVDANCQIPIGAGLGSSASTTVATISAVAKSRGTRLDRREIFKLAFIPENYLHGHPSGVDQATCTYGGIIQFRKPSKIKSVNVKRPPMILVCDSGIHRSTKALVGSVVKRSREQTEGFQTHLEEINTLSNAVVKALQSEDDNELGSLMNRNHELLRQIGVSTPMLNRLVAAARKGGALGAKLTGAGGGGCIIALCADKKARSRIARELRTRGGTIYNVSLDVRGVD